MFEKKLEIMQKQTLALFKPYIRMGIGDERIRNMLQPIKPNRLIWDFNFVLLGGALRLSGFPILYYNRAYQQHLSRDANLPADELIFGIC